MIGAMKQTIEWKLHAITLSGQKADNPETIVIQEVKKVKEPKEEPKLVRELKTQGLTGIVHPKPETEEEASQKQELKKED